MDYRTLGRAGVKVSRLCLGTMNLGGITDEAESTRIIHRAREAGINFIDTANIYNKGRSEEVVGKALAGKRDAVVLATKVWGPMGPGPNDRGCSRLHIMREVEASLRRLATDHIDLYQLHRPDETPMEEKLSALTDLVRQGKVRYIGTSNYPAWQLCQALWASDVHHYERFVSEQPQYSILSRAVEREVLPFCREHGFGVMPWSPLAGGWLTGKYRKGQTPPADSRGGRKRWDFVSQASQRRFDAVEGLIPIAEGLGLGMSRFALAWVMSNPAVTSPVIGPRTLAQLEDSLGALEVKLSAETLKQVDEVVPPGTELILETW
jgi:aryl-alcohol dehydrogenase-like predicted oxidoreductase